jgi:hypothetical protein
MLREAELAEVVGEELDAGRLPDLTLLRERFARSPALLSDIDVNLVRSSSRLWPRGGAA